LHALLAAVYFLLSLCPAAALAAGLFLPTHGVRPSMQAGAYVAAPADVYALSYNPAGLADAPNAALVDLGLPLHYSQVAVRGGGGDVVAGQGLGLPSPTLGLVHNFGLSPNWQFAAALTADYPAIQSAPLAVRQAGAAGRYGAADFSGTALAKLVVGAAYRPWDFLAVGLSGHLLLGRLISRSVVSACDGVVCLQPENPAYDVNVQLSTLPLAIPGLQAGISLRPTSYLKIGLAFETGLTLSRDADLQLRLPSAPLFDGASVQPAAPRAHLRLHIPWQGRVGVALQPSDAWHLEAALVWEPWSVHERLEVVPLGVQVTRLVGLGAVALPPLSIPRHFQNTGSVRLGGAYRFGLPGPFDLPLTVRGGASYEPGSVPDRWLMPMSLSLSGCLLSLGLEARVRRWTLMATVAHAPYASRQVHNSVATQINAVGAPSVSVVGNGTYQAQATLLGVGAEAVF
jgi:hypothetical protein